MSSGPFKVSPSLCLWTFDRKMKMFVVFVVLLHVSQQVSAVEMFQGDQFLLLPCDFPTVDLENPTVVWTRQDLSPPTVHQRLPEGDQLKDQNQLYRGRTSMKADALDSGDLSLNLTNLQLSDSGTYTCSVTDFGEELSRTDVELKVKGQRSLCPSCVSSERFPSWAIAILVLLVLIISAGVLFHHRHYFMSVYQVEVESGVESVLLPCKTTVQLSNVVWRDNDHKKVHVFENSCDHPEKQHEYYRNRTEMKKILLRTGDLSLTLNCPRDSRTFTCKVFKDRKVLMKKQVNLKVKVPQVEAESGAESVLLPCKTTVQLPEDVRVEWRDDTLFNRKIHVFENGSDQPGEQYEFYRNRTEINQNLLRTGDLSLTLRRPTNWDSGNFTCGVSSRQGKVLMMKQVKLKVKVQQVEVKEGAELVLLPFRTTPDLPGDSRVEWWECGNTRTVHLYENGSDQPETQDQLYRTRTRMSEGLLRTGDLSLTLGSPTGTDSGTYRCEVSSGGKLVRGKSVHLRVVGKCHPPWCAGRVQVPDPPEDIRTRTPLMAEESV